MKEQTKQEIVKNILNETDDLLHKIAVQYSREGSKAAFAVCESVHQRVIREIAKKYGVEINN